MKKLHLTIGHIGLMDSAPLLMAQERGYFEAEGLRVDLTCELGLATICGKLAEDRLDGACLPVQTPLLLSVGAGLPRVSMQALQVTSYQGMGIVVVKPKQANATVANSLRIGVIAPGSSAKLFLQRHQQLTPNGPLGDAVLVPMVASQLINFFRDGIFDGFCGIDPLPSLAAMQSNVVCVSDSSQLFPMHPGSVVALRTDVLERDPHAAAGLVRALNRAREDCENPANFEQLWRLVLSQCPYLELDAASRAALIKPLGENRAAAPSIRFTSPAKGVVKAGDAFLEAACRSALGAGLRTLDVKGEIARVYGTKLPSLAAHG
jgi:ABC-type nitrate/sulfonate/bicarbonate transport system substrate-binding protein